MPPDRFTPLHRGRINRNGRTPYQSEPPGGSNNFTPDEVLVDPSLASLAQPPSLQTSGNKDDRRANVESLAHYTHREISEEDSDDGFPFNTSQLNDEHLGDRSLKTRPSLNVNQTTTPPKSAQVRDFTQAANAARLDEAHQAIGLTLCNAPTERHLILPEIIFHLEMNQKLLETIGQLQTKVDTVCERLAYLEQGPTREPSGDPLKELRVWVKDAANKIVLRGDLEAYVGVSDSAGIRLNKSLTNLLGETLMAKPQRWRERVLGKCYGLHLSTNKGDWVRKLVHEKGKNARKELQRLSLTHIPAPGAENPAAEPPVPTLDTILYKVRKALGAPGEEVPLRDEILAATDHATRARQALVRLHIIHWAYKRDDFPGQSQWKSLDLILEKLRAESPRYRYAHAVLVLEDDRRFDGNRKFTEILADLDRQGVGLETPTKARVQVVMKELEERFGKTVHPDEASHGNIM